MQRKTFFSSLLAFAVLHGCLSNSWDPNLNYMAGQAKGSFDRGAIIGKDGSLWTTTKPSNALNITAQEAIAISYGIYHLEKFRTSGIFLEGVKYQFLRIGLGDGLPILGKKKDHGAITIEQSRKGIVIGHCPEGQVHGNLNKAVDDMVKYLENWGF